MIIVATMSLLAVDNPNADRWNAARCADTLSGLPLWGVTILARPCRPFLGPLRPFWIFEVLIEGMIKSKTYLAKVDMGVQ